MNMDSVLSPWRIIALFVGAISTAAAWKVNITKFENCGSGLLTDSVHVVRFEDITYQMVDGFCDSVSATYEIPTVNTAEKLLEITMFRCPTGSTGQCNDNAEIFVEHMHCQRFQTDNTGPWFMVSDAMSGSKCGESKGKFEMENARLKPEYLTQFMIQDVEHARHRMQILVMKKGKTEAENVFRACFNIEFDLVF